MREKTCCHSWLQVGARDLKLLTENHCMDDRVDNVLFVKDVTKPERTANGRGSLRLQYPGMLQRSQLNLTRHQSSISD